MSARPCAHRAGGKRRSPRTAVLERYVAEAARLGVSVEELRVYDALLRRDMDVAQLEELLHAQGVRR